MPPSTPTSLRMMSLAGSEITLGPTPSISLFCAIVYMEIVVDTNIFIAVALNESSKARIVEITADASLVAPDVLPYEIGNAFSTIAKRGQATTADVLSAERAAASIPVRLLQIDINAALQLACEHHIYAYDAYFLQCARKRSLALLTFDQRMKQIARDFDIDLLE